MAQETVKAAEAGKPSATPLPAPLPAQSSRGTASTRAASSRTFREVVMEDALKKPIQERDEDELLATAKAGKVRKTANSVEELALANV